VVAARGPPEARPRLDRRLQSAPRPSRRSRRICWPTRQNATAISVRTRGACPA